MLKKVPSDEFLGARLPSKKLLVFIYHHNEIKKTLSNAAKSASDKLQEVRIKSNIPVKKKDNICAGIQRLYKDDQNLCKEK